MKINRVKAKLLFGVFNHDIPLNEESGITIIIGENGLGKTMILEAINALFDMNLVFFRRLEFENFEFHFDNGSFWQLTKKIEDNITSLFICRDSSLKPVRKAKLHKIYQDTDHFHPRSRGRERELRYRRILERKRINNLNLELDFEDEHFQHDREFEQYRRMMEIRHKKLTLNELNSDFKLPKWFTDSVEKIRVKLIETQRIITAKEIGSDSYVNNLNKCSEELKRMIHHASKVSSIVTSELDSTYPNRLVKKLRRGSQDSFLALHVDLAKLDERRKLYSSSGLAVQTSDSDLLQIDEKQKDLVKVLTLYIDDSHKKLDPYEELSKKIELFKGIINKRFKHKKLEIKQDEGLIFRSTVLKNIIGEFETIESSKLSSGEQNELILFYKLIFNSNEDDMILIDEPELSLHISWQNKFIKDLKEVTSINDVSIVIATHSPDIIDENWDLKVELIGVE